MAGSVNKVDYDVLDRAKGVYANQAEALDSLINTLINMNSELQGSWTNQTAEAFVERFDSEHKVALQNARDAIQAISTYITNYASKVMEDDANSAAAI